MRRVVFVVSLACVGVSFGGVFDQSPVVEVEKGKYVVSFRLKKADYVDVSVLKNGVVVRHLVAGVIGGKFPPPPPLKQGLSQRMEWDGKDDFGKQVDVSAGDRLEFRVAVGFRAEDAGFVGQKPDTDYWCVGSIFGMGVGPRGDLYVLMKRSIIRYTPYQVIRRFDRNGRYMGTIDPPPGNLSPDKLKTRLGHTDEKGNPVLGFLSPNLRLVPYSRFFPPQTPIVLPNGNLLYAVKGGTWSTGLRLGLVEMEPSGAVAGKEWVSTEVTFPQRMAFIRFVLYMAIDRSGRKVFLSGLRHLKGQKPVNAVYVASLGKKEKAGVFFGVPDEAGKDEKHLNAPSAVAVDRDGRIYIADTGNDRVVILNDKREWVGSFDVASPVWVGVHAPSGNVYVYSLSSRELLRFSGDPLRVSSRIKLPYDGVAPYRWYPAGWLFAIDARSKKPRIWVGQFCNVETLVHYGQSKDQIGYIDDTGEAFSPLHGVVEKHRRYIPWIVTSDPTHRYIWIGGNKVLNEPSGEIIRYGRRLRIGGTSMVGVDGLLYVLPSAGNMRRFARDGKEVPFNGVRPGKWLLEYDKKGVPFYVRQLKKGERDWIGGYSLKGKFRWPVVEQGLPNCPSGTTGTERDFDIDLKGYIYIKTRGAQYHGEMKVDVFDRDGKFVKTVVWEIGDDAYGPRLDGRGNLYFAMGVSRKEGNAPAVFKSVPFYNSLYGSIVKFGPAGGMLHFWTPQRYEKNFGFLYPDLGLKKEEVSVIVGSRGKLRHGVILEGALWWRPGYSAYIPKGRRGNMCHCVGNDFDVDLFGRVFHPDTLMQRIVVLDASGNLIAYIGGYGNCDNRGSWSWIPDENGVLRPPTPEELKKNPSPFAGPHDVAFAFLNSVAVGRKFIYATDKLNERICRIRMKHEEEVLVPISVSGKN